MAGEQDKVEKYSPYCKKCESCGETGCCRPTLCQGGEGCEYPEVNLNELKLGWSMHRYFENEIWPHLPEELKAKYNAVWDIEYDKWHK
jgi:hypothetical protein